MRIRLPQFTESFDKSKVKKLLLRFPFGEMGVD